MNVMVKDLLKLDQNASSLHQNAVVAVSELNSATHATEKKQSKTRTFFEESEE